MKKVVAYFFGLIGFIMQGVAILGLPVYVIFIDGSAWWVPAFFLLGFAGMIPLSIMKKMIDENPR